MSLVSNRVERARSCYPWRCTRVRESKRVRERVGEGVDLAKPRDKVEGRQCGDSCSRLKSAKSIATVNGGDGVELNSLDRHRNHRKPERRERG